MTLEITEQEKVIRKWCHAPQILVLLAHIQSYVTIWKCWCDIGSGPLDNLIIANYSSLTGQLGTWHWKVFVKNKGALKYSTAPDWHVFLSESKFYKSIAWGRDKMVSAMTVIGQTSENPVASQSYRCAEGLWDVNQIFIWPTWHGLLVKTGMPSEETEPQRTVKYVL